ncbi:MAG TPA: hypothetical protein VER03_10505 [Bryobacteraceae bacterium]|nr:hypothetical protein [Bryobacteraceae bacterium]
MTAQAWGQSAVLLDWRRVGSTVVDLSLASLAGGPVDRVWYSADGSRLFARTLTRNVWQTTDFETWQPVAGVEPPERTSSLVAGPAGSIAVLHPLLASRAYAAGDFAYRSDDGGLNWSNVTGVRRRSILGGKLNDVAVSPRNPDEVVVAGANGVWRSMDGGDSWTGMNDSLPALPVNRILSSAADGGMRVVSNGAEVQWAPGERTAWRLVAESWLAREEQLRAFAASGTNATITAAASAGGAIRYAGAADGRLYFSGDNGVNWGAAGIVAGAGRVERINLDSEDPNLALAITQSRNRGRVLRTTTGGVFWEDLTGNLPAGLAVRGAAIDRASSAVYIATERGVYQTYTDGGGSPVWTLLRAGLAADVALDANANQLLVAFEDAGLFAALAPHRLRDPRVVSAADRIARAAAPGSLLSVIGARVRTATIGDRNAPVLAVSDIESQIQVPFDASGTSVQLAAATAAGNRRLDLTLLPASPSIFVDREGAPLVLNADTGLVLDAGAPARSGARLQILATGLGRVQPEWPTGLAAPLENAPVVVTPVQAYLDREPLEVTRATLAPGYIGMYLVEVKMPALVNRGTAELYIEAQGHPSNRIRIFLEP